MAIEYIEVAEAVEADGLRLVLTTGVPGPWGESAKGIFAVKGIDYVAVRQTAMTVDPALIEWTRQSSAPVAMYKTERPRSGWAEILFLAERLQPTPSLIPEDAAERALMLGLAQEICGEHGLGWTRRLMMFAGMPADEPESMPWKFGVSDVAAVDRAAQRTTEILSMLEQQLAASDGSYLMGDSLRAIDIYWACFSNLIDALPPEQSPMPDFIRAAYGSWTGGCPDSLIALRDRVFAQHLGLPQEY